jgi:hypothetical protein
MLTVVAPRVARTFTGPGELNESVTELCPVASVPVSIAVHSPRR